MTWKNILGNQMIILLFYTVIEAHARLTDPIPWNQNPSKTSPCGGISSPDIINSFSAGTLINIGWQVIAGDGAGDVIQSIDISGGTNFTSMVILKSYYRILWEQLLQLVIITLV